MRALADIVGTSSERKVHREPRVFRHRRQWSIRTLHSAQPGRSVKCRIEIGETSYAADSAITGSPSNRAHCVHTNNELKSEAKTGEAWASSAFGLTHRTLCGGIPIKQRTNRANIMKCASKYLITVTSEWAIVCSWKSHFARKRY